MHKCDSHVCLEDLDLYNDHDQRFYELLWMKEVSDILQNHPLEMHLQIVVNFILRSCTLLLFGYNSLLYFFMKSLSTQKITSSAIPFTMSLLCAMTCYNFYDKLYFSYVIYTKNNYSNCATHHTTRIHCSARTSRSGSYLQNSLAQADPHSGLLTLQHLEGCLRDNSTLLRPPSLLCSLRAQTCC